MTVYVEYVLINNFIIDASLLKASAKVLRLKTPKKRLILCGLLGAAASLIFPLVQNLALSFALKISVGFLLSLLSVKADIKESVKHFMFFTAFTFLFGGAAYAFKECFSANERTEEVFIALEFIPALVIYRFTVLFSKFAVKTGVTGKFITDCEISVQGKKYCVKGFFDSGNSVYCGFTPVLVCGKAFTEILRADMKKIKRDKKDYGEVFIKSYAGEIKTEVLLNAKIRISNRKDERIFKNVGLALGNEDYPYGVILHGSFMNRP